MICQDLHGDPVPLCFVSNLGTHMHTVGPRWQCTCAAFVHLELSESPVKREAETCAVSRLGPPSHAVSSPDLVSLHSSSMASFEIQSKEDSPQCCHEMGVEC